MPYPFSGFYLAAARAAIRRTAICLKLPVGPYKSPVSVFMLEKH
jgi:hypothetical protein